MKIMISLAGLIGLTCSMAFGQTGCSGSTCWGSVTISSGSSGIWIDPLRETRPKTNAVSLRLVKASAVPVASSRLAPAMYVTFAKSIGLESAATDEARLIQAIADSELPVFDYDKVDNYLYHQTLTMKIPMRWGWKPLRDSDTKVVTDHSYGAISMVQDGFGLLFASQYGGKVPEVVLETVAMVLKKVPDATFLISDYEVVKPDPFLMVTTPRMMEAHRGFIIAQWDEPGFGIERQLRFGPTVDQ